MQIPTLRYALCGFFFWFCFFAIIALIHSWQLVSFPSIYLCILTAYFPNLFFPLDYFSPSLPLQAAVAAAANISSATAAGVPGAPGGLAQGASGSLSPGSASYNIPTVNEGTDWPDGYHLGNVSQPYFFTLSLEILFYWIFSPVVSFLLSFSFLPSLLPTFHNFFIFPSFFYFSLYSPAFTLCLYVIIILPLPYALSISYSSSLLGSRRLISLLLHQSCFSPPAASVGFSSQVSRSSFVLVLVCSTVCIRLYLSVLTDFSPLSILSVLRNRCRMSSLFPVKMSNMTKYGSICVIIILKA